MSGLACSVHLVKLAAKFAQKVFDYNSSLSKKRCEVEDDQLLRQCSCNSTNLILPKALLATSNWEMKFLFLFKNYSQFLGKHLKLNLVWNSYSLFVNKQFEVLKALGSTKKRYLTIMLKTQKPEKATRHKLKILK